MDNKFYTDANGITFVNESATKEAGLFFDFGELGANDTFRLTIEKRTVFPSVLITSIFKEDGITTYANRAELLSENASFFVNASGGGGVNYFTVDGSGNNYSTGAFNLTATGANNFSLGVGAFVNANKGARNVSIGENAQNSNANADNNVGIGSSTLFFNTGHNNVAIGIQSLNQNTTGEGNTAVGKGSLDANTTFSNSAGIGANSQVTGDNQVQLGDSLTTTYAYGAVQNRSDIRDKCNITPTVLGLDFIMNLIPKDYSFDYRESYFTIDQKEVANPNFDEKKEVSKTNPKTIFVDVRKFVEKDGSKSGSRKHHGFIAQDIQELIKSTGVDFGGFQDHNINGGNNVLSIGYSELIAPMVKAIQELSKRVIDLENSL